MYAYISGTVASVRDTSAVIDCNGIGYRIMTPAAVRGQLRVGDEVTMYTHFSVSENAMQLYGFLTEDEVGIFRMLLGVGGVGPKSALSVLTVLDADDFRFAVISDDIGAIAKASGIAKKTASKIILELKDKMDPADIIGKAAEGGTVDASAAGSSADEAALALQALGYSASESLKAVRAAAALMPEAETEELIKAALGKLL